VSSADAGAASPFVLVLIAMCVSFALDVRADVRADPNLVPRHARARGT
jgi:choline-glycine betaine transporter